MNHDFLDVAREHFPGGGIRPASGQNFVQGVKAFAGEGAKLFRGSLQASRAFGFAAAFLQEVAALPQLGKTAIQKRNIFRIDLGQQGLYRAVDPVALTLQAGKLGGRVFPAFLRQGGVNESLHGFAYALTVPENQKPETGENPALGLLSGDMGGNTG